MMDAAGAGVTCRARVNEAHAALIAGLRAGAVWRGFQPATYLAVDR